jgi:hypothetical protein
MPSFEECKAVSLEYQKTGNADLFKRFLHRFEPLALYVCGWMKARNIWLQKVEDIDLEQTSYIGVHRAFSTVRTEERPDYIPLRVISYVKHALSTTYHYLKDEYQYYKKLVVPGYAEDWSGEGVDPLETATYSAYPSTDLSDYLTCPGINNRDAAVIQMVYGESRTLKDVAGELCVSTPRVHQIICRIHEKLKKVIEK